MMSRLMLLLIALKKVLLIMEGRSLKLKIGEEKGLPIWSRKAK
jgi:hypothetical protein